MLITVVYSDRLFHQFFSVLSFSEATHCSLRLIGINYIFFCVGYFRITNEPLTRGYPRSYDPKTKEELEPRDQWSRTNAPSVEKPLDSWPASSRRKLTRETPDSSVAVVQSSRLHTLGRVYPRALTPSVRCVLRPLMPSVEYSLGQHQHTLPHVP